MHVYANHTASTCSKLCFAFSRNHLKITGYDHADPSILTQSEMGTSRIGNGPLICSWFSVSNEAVDFRQGSKVIEFMEWVSVLCSTAGNSFVYSWSWAVVLC